MTYFLENKGTKKAALIAPMAPPIVITPCKMPWATPLSIYILYIFMIVSKGMADKYTIEYPK